MMEESFKGEDSSTKNDEAYLSNTGNYTVFKYGNYMIRFLTPYSLERYTKVKEWDNGYLVVMVK